MTTQQVHSTVEEITQRIVELKSLENDLIQKLSKEHQIVDCVNLLETLHERVVMNRMLEGVKA